MKSLIRERIYRGTQSILTLIQRLIKVNKPQAYKKEKAH